MKALVQHGTALLRQLLGFSHRGKYDVAARDLPLIVQQTAELFGRTHRDIALVLDLTPTSMRRW